MITINIYVFVVLCMLAGGGIVAGLALWYLLTRYSFVVDDDDDEEEEDKDDADWWKHPRNKNN